jgi:subtilisin family serine protease
MLLSLRLALFLIAFVTTSGNSQAVLAKPTHFILYKYSVAPALIGTQQERSALLSIERQVLNGLPKSVQSEAQSLWLANGTMAKLTRPHVERVRSHPLVRQVIKLSRRGRLTNVTYGLRRIKIPELRARFLGLDGAFIRIGVIDTGVDEKHPDLFGRVVGYRDYIDSRITLPRDDHGHGSHVSGTAAGAISLKESVGVAPRAQLLVAKTFDSRGNSKDSDMLLAMQWLADPDDNPSTEDFPKVINSSWNVDGDITKIDFSSDPFCIAISKLRALGIASVVAAGNDGPRKSSIKIPGSCPDAITVAATDQRDQVTDFSSRGPAVWKNAVVEKPDLAAPGKDINSADTGGGYRTRSGTSMAAPHVTGLLALVFQRGPNLTVDEAIAVLKKSATDLGSAGVDSNSGSGLINSFKTAESL